jgi:N-acetyl-anhydromuramyl-L-alanine amidase AmpD
MRRDLVRAAILIATSLPLAATATPTAAAAAPPPAAAASRAPAAPPAAAASRAPAGPPAQAATGRQAAFVAAAAESGVPLPVLLAVSYAESRWEAHGGRPSTAAGYGPMNLTDLTEADLTRAGFGGDERRRRDLLTAPALHTAAPAAALIRADPATVKADDVANIRAGAALLASYARRYNGGQLPTTISGWAVGVARYAEASETKIAQLFAEDVYATIRAGATATTQDGQTLTLRPVPWAFIDPAAARALGLVPAVPPPDPVHNPSQLAAPECPSTLSCTYSPSGFFNYDPSNKAFYGDHDPADRPRSTDIRYIVLHDTEETDSGTLWLFHDPTYFASAHYEVRSEDGHVTQLVPTRNIAWDSGNEAFYQHSVAIEQEGFAVHGATWYSEAMYRSTAALVRYLAARFGVPLDRQHILGHDNVPGGSNGFVALQHWDPGPYWDWAHFLDLLGAPIRPATGPRANAVTINPIFPLNREVLTGCEPTQGLSPYPGPYHGPDNRGAAGPDCHGDLPRQPVNFVWLRTAPSDSAPLIADPYLHPDGSAGTTRIEDWGDRAATGQRFAVAGRSGDWTAIWYAGRKAWFRNPMGMMSAVPARATLVTPKPGRASIPVYLTSFPEASAYPPAFVEWWGGIPRSQRVADRYTIPAGQSYVTAGPPLVSDWFNAFNIDGSAFMDQTDFTGRTRYRLITYNHRMAFVDAADVDVVPA